MRRLGPYLLEAPLGTGGQARVFRARHAELGRRVALKLATPEGAGAAARFLREARLLSALAHPNLPRAYDYGQESGTLWLAMDEVEGIDLNQRVLRQGPLDPWEAAALLIPLAEALAYCHGQGVLHRDVNPKNVVQRPDDTPVLIDFGLARPDPASGQTAESLSKTGQILGTPAYVAPEQIDPRFGSLSPATDVYGLGATLYYLLCGRPPCDGASPLEVYVRVVDQPPEPPSAVRSAALEPIPARLEALCARALAKRPQERPPSAQAMAVELFSIARAGPDRPGRAGSSGDRRASPLALLAAAAVLAGGGAAVGLAFSGGAPGPTDSPSPRPTAAPVSPDPGPKPSPAPASPVSPGSAPDSYPDPLSGPPADDGFTPSTEFVSGENARALVQLIKRYQGHDAPGTLAAANDLLEGNPDQPIAWALRAWANLQLGRHAQALTEIRRSRELGDSMGMADWIEGTSLVRLGDAEAGRPLLERAHRLRPRNGHVMIALGVARRVTGDPAGALALYDQARATVVPEQQGDLLRNVVNALLDLDRLEEILRRCDAALADDPDMIAALEHRALALFKLERLAESEGAWSDYLVRRPTDHPARFARARVRLARGDRTGTLEDLHHLRRVVNMGGLALEQWEELYAAALKLP